MEYKEVRYIKFLGEDVRIVDFNNIEYIVVKDIFKALGRLNSNGGTNNDDRKKIKRMFGNDIIKINIRMDKAKNTTARKTQVCMVVPYELILKRKGEILLAFGKNGINTVGLREEHNFITNVKNFFKDTNYSIKTQFPIMEYRVDLAIGNMVFVEFDEDYHKHQKDKDIKRMDNICKSVLIENKNGELYLNKFEEEFPIKYLDYDDYEIYEGILGLFIRVKNENCLSWIPHVFNYYNEYSWESIYKEPEILIHNSKELDNLKIIQC